jgi:signal transduction histidine kinase
VPLVTLCESTRSAAITNDASSDPRANPITRKTLGDARSVLTVPLLVRGTVIGILVFASSWMDVFDDAAMDFAIRLSASVSLALENARLYESERAEAEAIAAINSELCAANDDLKLANIKLENVNTLLDEATNAKSRFLSSMSHELRTPLNSVIGFSKVLLKGMAGPLNAEQERQVRMITESGERLLALINDVLDLSRIEAGGLQLETQRFSVTDSLDSVLMSTRPLADEKGITLRLMKPCCDPYLVSDPTRFQEILLNLVGNAIKFTDEGSVAVEVACPEGWLQMSVSDTGRGIPPEHLDRIFDDFYQVPDKDGAQIVGTGLGLPLSRKLAEALGGSITVRSELGVGSTFTLSLPATDKTPEGKREEVVLPTEAASGEPRSKQKASATQAHSRR